MFYRYSSFIFHSREAVLAFLIGIGRENASVLRSVKGFRDIAGQRLDLLEIIKPFITQHQISSEGIDIWNDQVRCLQLYDVLKCLNWEHASAYWHTCRTYRPLWPEAGGDVSSALYDRCRFRLKFDLLRYGRKSRRGTAEYELRTRWVRTDDPACIAALQGLENMTLPAEYPRRLDELYGSLNIIDALDLLPVRFSFI